MLPSATPSWWSKTYNKIEMADEDDDSQYSIDDAKKSQMRTARNSIFSCTQIILYLLSAVGLVSMAMIMTGASIAYNAQATSTPVNARPCGNSSAEARANGCVFNQLAWAWVPKTCPSYADPEFKEYREWKYYEDLDGNMEAATKDVWEKVYNNEMPLYTIKGEHMTHCVYLLLSQAQIVRDGSKTIPKMREYGHIEHCAKHLLMKLKEVEGFDKIGTRTPRVSYEQAC